MRARQATPLRLSLASPRIAAPPHPSLSLEEAIRQARIFYQRENFTRAAPEVALKHWGYGAKSSSGLRTLAALLTTGSSLNRVSEMIAGSGCLSGRRPFFCTPMRMTKSVIRQSGTLLSLRGSTRFFGISGGLTSHLTATWDMNLIRHYDFNPGSVPSFIKDFKATIEFAKLAQSGKLSSGEGDGQRTGHAGENGARRDPPPSDSRRGGTMPDTQRKRWPADGFPYSAARRWVWDSPAASSTVEGRIQPHEDVSHGDASRDGTSGHAGYGD